MTNPNDPAYTALTIREYFAGLALNRLSREGYPFQEVARLSIALADALIKTLNEKPNAAAEPRTKPGEDTESLSRGAF